MRSGVTTSGAQFHASAGVEYAGLIAAELGEQRVTRSSLERRAVAVVSASAVLVTALFGLVAFATTIAIRHDVRLALYAALGLFVLAALGGLAVGLPMRYLSVEPHGAGGERGLEETIRDSWGNPPPIARRRVALTRVALYQSYKIANRRKTRILLAATVAEVAAVAALAAAVALTLHARG